LIISLAGNLKAEEQIGKALTLKGLINYRQGRYDKTIEYSQESLRIGEKLQSKYLIACSLGNIGAVFERQGHYNQALEYHHKSLEIREELGDKYGIADSLNHIGFVHSRHGNYTEALEYLHKSLKLREAIGEKYDIANSLNNIGLVYSRQGNYIQALEYLHNNLKLEEENGNKQGISHSLNNIGLVYYNLGYYTQALEYFHKSLKIKEEIGNKDKIAGSLNNIGSVFEKQGNYTQALEYLHKSLKIFEEIGSKQELAYPLYNIGDVYNSQGNYTQALEYYYKGLEISKGIGDNLGNAYALSSLARVYNSLGRHALALDFSSRAAQIASQGNNLEILWYSLLISGYANAALGKTDVARKSLLDSIYTIEQLRLSVSGPVSSQPLFFQEKVAPYHALVSLLIKSNHYDQAFQFAERAKARTLLDQLKSIKPDLTKHLSYDEIAQDQKLRSELISLNAKLSKESQKPELDQALISDLKEKREKARLRYEDFQSKLYIAHPELRLQRGDIDPISINDASGAIDQKSAILEYVVTEDNTHLFLLMPHINKKAKPQLNVYTIKIKRRDLDKVIADFHQKVANRDLSVRRPAQELYKLLIKPAEDKLKNLSHLFIVPDGSLWDLPFQALDKDGNNWLIESFSISYAPSLSALLEMKKKKSIPVLERLELLALGNPKIDARAIEKVKLARDAESFDPLPFAEKEVINLAVLYGNNNSKVLIGPQAKEEVVKAEAGKYRILHFATHGVLDDKNPMYSRLMLASGDGKTEDGMLEAWEIMRMNLNADMAVLAACETARGKVSAGEGVIGISWAMFVAGVPTTVVSQWKVASKSTSEMMIEFHKNIKLKKSKAEALREASLRLMKEGWGHPYYWAGFTVVGDKK
jgi:CHAT domain-containing protein/Tfp pilus assembly protein PilF